MKLFLAILCVCLVNAVEGIAPENIPDNGKDLRITKLLPGLLTPFAINPALPNDFVAMSPNGTQNLYEAVYWGPKKALEDYFKNPNSLSESIIRIKLSSNVAQSGPKEFNHNTQKMVDEMKEIWPKDFCFQELQWGMYPVITIKTRVEKEHLIMGWVGLNDPEAGWTLVFNLVYPQKKGRPNKKDLELWNNLLSKTTQLADHDFFVAHGQDLQPGYTIVRIGNAKLKMTAEKRQRDGLLQVVVQPISAGVIFVYQEMDEGVMGAEWKYAEPLVKVYGTIIQSDGSSQLICNHVTSIFVESVSEFSVDTDVKKEGFNIYQKVFEPVAAGLGL